MVFQIWATNSEKMSFLASRPVARVVAIKKELDINEQALWELFRELGSKSS